MLVSGVQQSVSITHIHILILSQILFSYSLSQSREWSSLCYTIGPWRLSIFYTVVCVYVRDLPSGSAVKNSPALQKPSILGLGRFPWRRKQQPAPVFWPGTSHGQSLEGYSLWGCKETRQKRLSMHTGMHVCVSLKLLVYSVP